MDPLLNSAIEAAMRAYAPYSDFRVGAAVELHDSIVVTGSNQECSAFGASICAERVALSYAMATYPASKVHRIAIYSPESPEGISPCGVCREFIAECARRSEYDIEIVGLKGGKTVKISELLPQAFTFTK